MDAFVAYVMQISNLVLCHEGEYELFANFIVYLFYYREISRWF